MIRPPDDPAAVLKSRGKSLDLDDPKVLAELGIDPALLDGYAKAQESLENGSPSATATPSATSFTPSELHGSGVAVGCPSTGARGEGNDLPQETAALLEAIIAYVLSYSILSSDAQATAIALWVLNTYVYDLWDYTPYLSISSATKRSGKSRVLDILNHVVARPWLVITPSTAAMFRKIEEDHPTLLLDEQDSITQENREAIRALLNAGFESERTIARMMGEGKNMQLQEFDVYCPKALAGIGKFLSDTTHDRTIPIVIKRKNKEDKLPRFRKRKVKQSTLPLTEQFEKWAARASSVLAASEPPLPDELHDRAADIWEPLLAIADLAGDDWPKRAREAAIELHSGKEEEAINVLLLRHLRDLFDEDGGIALHTGTILDSLIKRDDGPWAKFWEKDIKFGNTLQPARRLAQLLDDFDIFSKDVKLKGETKKGYRKEDFMDAWRRYLDDDEAPPSLTSTEPLPTATPQPSQVRGHISGSGSGSGSGSVPTWLFRCDGCGDEQEDASTTRMPGMPCFDVECGGKYRLVNSQS